MQPAELSNGFDAWPQEEMIRIRENDPRVHLLLEPFETYAFERTLRADGHKDRRLDGRPARSQRTRTRVAIGRIHMPVDRFHKKTVLDLSLPL
jgi:hypothetical protein